MKPETESSVSKAKTKRKSAVKKNTAKQIFGTKSKNPVKSVEKIEQVNKSERTEAIVQSRPAAQKPVTDLEFLDTVRQTVYMKLLDNELDLKIDSGFKAIELKNKISETSENEKLLLEILAELRSDELKSN